MITYTSIQIAMTPKSIIDSQNGTRSINGRSITAVSGVKKLIIESITV
jgi:hypothetical protein